MATRAATFSSKIKNLKDYHYRIVNNLTPQPSGTDVANTLKFFSQTLLSVLKDVPSIPSESYGPQQRDSVRLSVFPNLNYSGLYHAALTVIDLVPMVQLGQLDLGEAVLNVLGCLVPFLMQDLLDSLPFTVASTLVIFPSTLHKDTIDLLCTSLLPMTLGYDGCQDATYTSESAAAIISMVFQHTENSAFHSQILECFMSMKMNVINDLLCVIAYGSPAARAPAAHLLFYYWPQLNPSLSDRRGIHYKYCPWPPILCKHKNCINSGNCQAAKMCLNPALTMHSSDLTPPLYICSDCVDLCRDQQESMSDMLLPMSHVSSTCENKNCQAEDNIAVCTCFSVMCAKSNGNRPIRYCQTCHEQRHHTPGHQNQRHMFHVSILSIWNCTPEVMRYLMDAIVSLLKEAFPVGSKRIVEMGEEHRHALDNDDLFGIEDAGERKLLSRYGIWLLVELCHPQHDIPIEVLGRMLGMLFQWFDATAYLPDDNIGNALEKLKPEYIYNWLQDVMENYFEVVVACLLPHPVEYSKVGGFWDTLCTRTTQIKEGINCFFCLVPYNIITFEIWDYVMPYWLESIRTEVPQDELSELKVLLSKAFDIDMCPLPFTLDKMYNFVSDRFDDDSALVQEQALQWLQILSRLDIIIPMHLLLRIFKVGVERIEFASTGSGDLQTSHQPSVLQTTSLTSRVGVAPMSPQKLPDVPDPMVLYDRETQLVLPCFTMMLDMVLRQMELQESPRHLGIYNETSRRAMGLLTSMVGNPWDGHHQCDGRNSQRTNCSFCQNIALWHQMAAQILSFVCPSDPLKLPFKDLPHADHIQKQTISESPAAKPDMSDDKGGSETTDHVFSISNMPVYLQLFNALSQLLSELCDTDTLFAVLSSLKYLILHGESLNYTINQFEHYITHVLKNCFIPSLWKLLTAERSHLATLIVPLLLHCLTLSSGAGILWHLVEDDFSCDDWKARFGAVEKVATMAQCLDVDTVRTNHVVMTSLAHCFCHIVGSVEDINSAVAQRTIIFLETVRPCGIKCLIHCLEFQFDTVIQDRGLILHRIQLLSLILSKDRILTWDFFMNRFDTLSLEAQVDLESSGDISHPTDLASSDKNSDHFLHKLNRARLALARTDSIRSVSENLKGKPPYRRAVSVPLHLITKGLAQSLGGHLRVFTDEESNFAALLQRAMDLEGIDRDVVYQLVALLMNFMIHSEEHVLEGDSKAQNIVLRHLNVLLGYNQTEKSFSVPPFKLRSSAVFNAFLSGIPFVLDRNFKLGNAILPISLLLLQYCPSPQRYASDYQPPNYTLWYLQSHTRLSWLKSLLIILYKYQISISPVSTIIQTLVQLVINTIEAQHHRCRKLDDAFPLPTPTPHRSKANVSKISISDLERIQETETPPQSPSTCQEGSDDEAIELTQPLSTINYTKSSTNADSIRERGLENCDTVMLSISPSQKEATNTLPETSVSSCSESSSVNTFTHAERPYEVTSNIYSRLPADEDGIEESERTVISYSHLAKQHVVGLEETSCAEEKIKDGCISSTNIMSSKQKERKTGLTTILLQKQIPDLYEATSKLGEDEKNLDDNAETVKTQRPCLESTSKMDKHSRGSLRESAFPFQLHQQQQQHSHCAENILTERCAECNVVLEQYDDETISLCITVLTTFVHREPTLATPMLLSMLQCVSRIASRHQYSWQSESHVIIPGNSMSTARQFLRCVLHQMAPNGIFPMLFQSSIDNPQFLKTMASALVDFCELPAHAPLLHLLEGLNKRKNLSQTSLSAILVSSSIYLSYLSLDGSVPLWTSILTQFDIFFRRLLAMISVPFDVEPVLTIIATLLKVNVIGNVRSILDPFSKVLSFTIQNCTFKLHHLIDICSFCNRAFTRERDKLVLTRTVIFELVNALRFKSQVLDDSLLIMVQFLVLDAGGAFVLLGSVSNTVSITTTQYTDQMQQSLISTCAAECMRQHLNDCIDFIGDLHTLSKVKSNSQGNIVNLNEDTLGSHLKSGIAQYVALEITLGNGRDHRAMTRYLPWLYHPPTAMQQGPREFIDCVSHIRLLSWLMIGSLTHTALTEDTAQMSCLPIPLEASSHIADHVMVIMTGFAEQSNASVLHMSSLFHAFILCQLWTMYCESAAAMECTADHKQADVAMVMDFWARVTPGIMQLLSHSKVLAEMVNLHFLSLMEALQECNSFVLVKQAATSVCVQLPSHLRVRMQAVQNWEPPLPAKDHTSFSSSLLLTWLRRIQFKLGQIELQSSAATQIYVV